MRSGESDNPPFRRKAGAVLATLAVAAAAGACAGSPGAQTAPAPAGTSTAHLEEIYRARMDSARMQVHEADVRFMTGMIGHHAQALVMAALAPTNDAGPEIRILTGRVINAQRDEIALMQQWLRDREQPVPEVHIDGTHMMVHGPEYTMHMPGMLSAEQMAELEAARGDAFDRLFLRYMIQHHEGAVTMVHDLFAIDGAALDDAVFKIASDIQVDQITEIDRMKLMLRRTSGEEPGIRD